MPTPPPLARAPLARAGALSEAEILEVALAIIEEHGIDGLTMRQLSSRLGVALGATYHHVKNKDALLVLVAQSLFDRVEIPALDDPRDWTLQVREVLLSLTDVFTGQGELAAWVLAHFAATAPSEIMIRMRGMLANAGFGPEATEEALNPLFFYVAGMLVGGFTSFGDAQTTWQLRQNFERGLDIILTGIRVDLQP
ncbi:MAG TPA: helix-turn-helix domain-containing protein [Acidimicrobiia bacterium]|jgi:AcrR family transcriptional regulator